MKDSFDKALDRTMAMMAEKHDLSHRERHLVEETFAEAYAAGRAAGLIEGGDIGHQAIDTIFGAKQEEGDGK